MNTLCMGLPFGTGLDLLARYRSHHGHDIRTLAIEGPADFAFRAEESIGEVIDRVNRDWPVDTLVCWVPELFPPPRELETCPLRTVAAISDWNLYFPQLEYNLARFDLVLTDKLGAQSLRLPHSTATYLAPLYSHHPEHHYDERIPRDIDVLFAGNLSPAVHVARGRVLEQVAALADQWHIVLTSGLDVAAYRRALSRAKIVVNYGLRHEMNLRCFETLACGALLFMEEENLEASDLLEEGEHFVAYRLETVQELLEQYLTREDERKRIAMQGLRRAQEIAGDTRLDGLLDSVATLAAGVRPYRYFDDRQKRLAECMLYGSSHVASQRALASTLVRDAESEYPDDPETITAAALMLLSRASEDARDARSEHVQAALHRLQRVTELMSEAAVAWLNLAFVCARSNVPDSEARFLELALETNRVDLGGLLLGTMDDPYYVAWRRALATGDRDLALLHGYAHARLARLLLGQGKDRDALSHAEAAMACRPDFAPPYRIAGRAALDLGMPEHAVDVLRTGLARTSFDAEMRLALLHALHDMGDAPGMGALAMESARIFGASPKMEHLAAMFQEYCEGGGARNTG